MKSVMSKELIRQTILLIATTAAVYTLFSYGGIRSPDSEIVFRTAEALAATGTFALTTDITQIKGFGLPQGKDGQLYSLFGPGESLFAAPFVKIALIINRTRWYEHVPRLIPVSHYVDAGILTFVDSKTPENLEPHALRFLVSCFNVVVGSLCVGLFFLTVKLLSQSEVAAILVTILFAFGSLMMPYSGSFFSEPLATMFVLLSLYCLVWNDLSHTDVERQRTLRSFVSGISLGLAVITHITAILFVPFFAVYAFSAFVKEGRTWKQMIQPGLIFVAGVALMLVLLGFFNFARFGNIFETGRTVNPKIIYASFVAPWRGLVGLLVSSGKGIVWYCPAVIVSLISWRSFHKRYTFLSFIILTAVVFRVCLIAARSDWHGGYSLGPRYLVMIVPLMLLPLGEALVSWFNEGKLKMIWLFCGLMALCIWEQIYFCIGEIFSFLHVVRWSFDAQGTNVFQNDSLYLDWDKSPLLYLLNVKQGPFLFRIFFIDNYTLFLWGIGISGIILFLVYTSLLRKSLGRWC